LPTTSEDPWSTHATEKARSLSKPVWNLPFVARGPLALSRAAASRLKSLRSGGQHERRARTRHRQEGYHGFHRVAGVSRQRSFIALPFCSWPAIAVSRSGLPLRAGRRPDPRGPRALGPTAAIAMSAGRCACFSTTARVTDVTRLNPRGARRAFGVCGPHPSPPAATWFLIVVLVVAWSSSASSRFSSALVLLARPPAGSLAIPSIACRRLEAIRFMARQIAATRGAPFLLLPVLGTQKFTTRSLPDTFCRGRHPASSSAR